MNDYDYLAKPNQNGNGNGNGNAKNGDDGKFKIEAKEDPILAHVAPSARRAVFFDTTIPESARLLYCFLIDCSLWRGVATRPGVIRMANSYLARRLKVSEKTIQNWKRALIETGRVWCTEKWMKNSYPQTVYNIVAIVGQQMLPMEMEDQDGSLPEDEVTSNRRRPRLLKRDSKGKWIKGGSKTVEISKSVENAENAADTALEKKILPSSAATNFRAERQSIAAGNGNHLPSATETNCREERQSIAARNGNHLPLSAETNCRGPRKTVADNKESLIRVKSNLRVRGTVPPPQNGADEAFRSWVQTLDKMLPSKWDKLRDQFKAQLKTERLSEAGRALLKRKLKVLAEKIEGPPPEQAEEKPISKVSQSQKPANDDPIKIKKYVADLRKAVA